MPGTVWRICDRATFAELRRRGRRCRSGPLNVVRLDRPASGPPRVAYAVGRQVGSAVVRNRVRRRLRAAAAELAATGELRSGSYLVVASPAAADAPFTALRSRLRAACADLSRPAA
ncbi:MAG TPA: ribonuclease P protein component [Acidimicrobiales bacterium]|nr:ribonuclease P protein component [Acidimicrobiales bacterium]